MASRTMHFERAGYGGGVMCCSKHVPPTWARTSYIEHVTCNRCLTVARMVARKSPSNDGEPK